MFPSLHEGSAFTVFEALASGLPVVTTPNAGSVVRDGEEGYIVPIRDVPALMDRILRLYENVDLRGPTPPAKRIRNAPSSSCPMGSTQSSFAPN